MSVASFQQRWSELKTRIRPQLLQTTNVRTRVALLPFLYSVSLPQNLVMTKEQLERPTVSGSSDREIPNCIEDLEIKDKNEATQ